MSRILHHVGRNDFKKTRQRQIGEQKERAAQKLKEWQEAEVERKQIEEEARPYKSNWRRENLREFGEWAPIETSGPTNSTSTTFGYFAGGSPVINGETGQQVTFTYSGLDGVENYPTSVTIDQGGGDTFQTAPPPFSQVGVQGYTAKLNPRYAEAKKKYDEEWKEWERKKEQQQKDIEATLKSFGTSYRDVQRDGGITKVGNSYVAIIPTNTRDFGSNLLNNVRVVRLVPCDPSQPMELTKNVRDISGTKKWNVSNAQYSHDVYLQIGEQPKAPIEQEYLMPRRTDFKDVNPQLDASQEFAQQVGADELMNARVQDLTPLSKNPYGIDYGEIASTNLRGLLQDPNANYSMNRKGELYGLKVSMYGKYMNPFVRGNPVTEKDFSDQDLGAMRRHIQQLLDHPNAEDPESAAWNDENNNVVYAQIKKRERVTREQFRTYGMVRGDRIYSVSPYVNPYNFRVRNLRKTNDLATLMGNTTVITDRRGRVKRLVDDFDFLYGYERADSGLPGTPVTKRKSGPSGVGFVEKGEENAVVYSGVPEQLGRIGINAARGIGIGNPIPINIKFR